MKFTSFKHFCREFKGVPIYALYPESFCVKNLAIRKVCAFSDSGVYSDRFDADADAHLPMFCTQQSILGQGISWCWRFDADAIGVAHLMLES